MELSEYLTFANGRTSPPRSDNSVYPVYGANGPIGNCDTPNFSGPAIVIGRVGSYCGNVQYVCGDFWATDNTIVATPLNSDEGYYWKSFLKNFDPRRLARGSGQPLVTQADLKQITVNPPPRSIRVALSQVLGSLDDKIAANQAVIDTGNDLLMSLYRGTPKRNAEPFEQVCDVFGGSTPSTKVPEYWGGEIRWATPTDLTALKGPWLNGTERTITEDGLRSMSSALHPEGSILMTSRATIGSVALAAYPVTTNQGFIVVRAPEDLTPWTYCQLRDRVPEFEAWANGATFLELSRGNFKKLAFQRAEPERLTAFNKTAWPLLEMCKTKQMENITLAKTRDELLPLLMNGKISVREAEQEATSAGADIPSEEIEA
ncbi:restriction endonuclease subunit S [Brevibacterium sp. UMB10442]|nr:restriction endonuclease subunit S [Brevibacterium sp. UMB10442]